MRLLVCDVDGCLTNGKVNFMNDKEIYTFNIHDGWYMKQLLEQGVKVIWISGRGCNSVLKRGEEIGVTEIYLKVKNKYEILKSFQEGNKIRPEETIIVGDGIIDISMSKLGFFCVPNDCVFDEVISCADFILEKNGGDGIIQEIYHKFFVKNSYKILITGGDGYIASILKNNLNDHTIISKNKHDLNCLDSEQIDDFFEKNEIDVVIHTAIFGGRRTKIDSSDIIEKNIRMFFNLYKHIDKIKLFLNFGSGASFCKSKNIQNMNKKDLKNIVPLDPYGFSKNIIERVCSLDKKCINLRLFGSFGILEKNDRFIKQCIRKCKNNEEFVIHKDIKMDFFFEEDIKLIVKDILDSKFLRQDVNLCYKKKYSLSEIAQYIKQLSNSCSNIIINEHENIFDYTGKFDLDEKYDGDILKKISSYFNEII